MRGQRLVVRGAGQRRAEVGEVRLEPVLRARRHHGGVRAVLVVVAVRRGKRVDLRKGGEEVERGARGVGRPVVGVGVVVRVGMGVGRRRAGGDGLGQHLLRGAQALRGDCWVLVLGWFVWLLKMKKGQT